MVRGQDISVFNAAWISTVPIREATEELFTDAFDINVKGPCIQPSDFEHWFYECIWLNMPVIKEAMGFSRKLFPRVEYGFATIPAYPCGQISLMVCSKDPNATIKELVRHWLKEQEAKLCRYCNAEIQKAYFALLQFARSVLEAPEESK
ncbi:hypothetical protein EC968_002127 [Mortierella alpina]|nr:hypothetical protein EC968_002127 [Mortierella alpina]